MIDCIYNDKMNFDMKLYNSPNYLKYKLLKEEFFLHKQYICFIQCVKNILQ